MAVCLVWLIDAYISTNRGRPSRDKEVSKHWILGFTKNYGEPATMAGLEARKTDENSGIFTCPEGKDGDGTDFPCQADCGTQ